MQIKDRYEKEIDLLPLCSTPGAQASSYLNINLGWRKYTGVALGEISSENFG